MAEEETLQTKRFEILYQSWEKIQEKQMHFDDMIMRLRSLSITVFISTFSAIIVLWRYKETIDSVTVFSLLLIPICFWIITFITDYYYYYKLLLGSIKCGVEIHKKLETFGLQLDINEHLSSAVRKKHADCIIISFYTAPLIVGLIAFVVIATFSPPAKTNLETQSGSKWENSAPHNSAIAVQKTAKRQIVNLDNSPTDMWD